MNQLDRIYNKKEVMVQTQDRKVYMAPQLEVLDGRKTYGGLGGNVTENDWTFEDPEEVLPS